MARTSTVLSILYAVWVASLSLAMTGAKAPNFECKDSDGTVFRVWIDDNFRTLQVTREEQVKEFSLAAANLWRVAGAPGRPLVYNRFDGSATSPLKQLDMSIELSTQYSVENGATRVKIGLVLDHRERTGLACTLPSSPGTTVVTALGGSVAQRSAALLNDAAALRSRDGSLEPVGILGVEAALLRVLNSPDFKNPQTTSEFAAKAAPGIKKIAPQSVALLRNRFKGSQRALWNSLVQKTQYLYYPEVKRYATWVVEGCRPYPDRRLYSVLAGFKAFVDSKGYQTPDIRQYFTTEVTPALKQLDDFEINQVKEGLGSEATTFLSNLWARSHGKRTLADSPMINQMATEIGTLVTQKDFDPAKVQAKLESFLQMPAAADPSTRGLFVQAASLHIKKLTPRQREDVMGWCQEAEKELLLEMLH